jgi:hypothetical protein
MVLRLGSGSIFSPVREVLWRCSWTYTILSAEKNVTVQKESSFYNVSFRRILIGDKLNRWHQHLNEALQNSLGNYKDRFKWSLHHKGNYSVNYMYKALMLAQALPLTDNVWKIKVPLKRKVFMWYLINE